MKKLIFSLSLLALTTAAFAKTETPSKTEGKSTLNVYYVNGMTATHYTLSTSPNPECGEGEARPCEITSEAPLGTSVPKAQLDSPAPGIHVIERQPEF